MGTVPGVDAGDSTDLFSPASTPYDQDAHDPDFPDVNPATGDERETTGPDGKPL